MLTLNQPPLTQHISIPKDMAQLSVEAYTAGIVEGVMDGLGLVRLCSITCVPYWVEADLTSSRQESLHIPSERINFLNVQ